jgi:fibro-slime domain-containing protein
MSEKGQLENKIDGARRRFLQAMALGATSAGGFASRSIATSRSAKPERVPGYAGDYYNLSENHPDMQVDGNGQTSGLVEETLPIRLTDKGQERIEQFDWYDSEHHSTSRIDEEIQFGSDFFPLDEGKQGDPYHFAVHWRATIDVPEDGTYSFSTTSDDDSWVFVGGQLVVDNGGLHARTTRDGAIDLSKGTYNLDVFHAERHTVGSVMVFEPDSRVDVYARRNVVVEQGDRQFEVAPLSGDQTAEEFYDYWNGAAHTATGIERSDVSQLFFWEGPDDLSLGVLHDTADDDTGGAAVFDTDGLPTDYGEWVVQDDPEAFDSPTDTTPAWNWYKGTDGGVFSGSLDSGFEITIDPEFKSGVDEWQILSPGDDPVGTLETNFDFPTDELDDNGWTASKGSFKTSNSKLGAEGTRQENIYHEQPRATGTFEMRGVQNTAYFYGQRSAFISDSTTWGETRGYGVVWRQTRHGEVNFVRLDGQDGGEVLLQLTGDHSGELNDVRIERDPDTYEFECYYDGEFVGSVTDDTYTDSKYWVQRHDDNFSDQTIDGVAAVDDGGGGEGEPVRRTLQKDEPVTLHYGRVLESASVESAELPPTAVEIDESVPFSVTVDPGSYSADEIEVEARATISRDGTHLIETTASTSLTETEDGLVVVEGEFAPAVDLHGSPLGLGYGSEITVTANGAELLSKRRETYAFERVEQVAAIAARASDTSLSSLPKRKPIDKRGQNDLYGFLRRRAEFLNQFYASGLGLMGTTGFDVEFVTDTEADISDGPDDWPKLQNGWLGLEGTNGPNNQSGVPNYSDGAGSLPENSKQFLDDAIAGAETELGVDFTAYDSAMAVNDNPLSRPFCMGEIVPQVFETDWFEVRLPDVDEPVIPIQPRTTPSGVEIVGMYVTRDGHAWRHEFGHSLGPNLQIGFPELYNSPGPITNWGNVGNWGVMGSGDAVTSFLRSFWGNNLFDGDDDWLDIDLSLHFIDDQSVSPGALSEKEVGDAVDYLLSAYATFDVTVEWNLNPFNDSFDVEIEEADVEGGLFILEGRTGEDSHVEDPVHGTIPTSPNNQTGVALYHFGTIEFGDKTTLERFLDDSKEFVLDADVIDHDYIPAHGDQQDVRDPNTVTDITLSEGTSTYFDPGAAATFELTEPTGEGGPEVEVSRDVSEFIEDAEDLSEKVVSVVVDLIGDIEDQLQDTLNDGEPAPNLDVIAETPDGRRVGTDPETGEVVNEIDGAQVRGTLGSQTLLLPGDVDVTVDVSAKRLREHLSEHGYEPPEFLKYERTTYVDNDPTVVERDGLPYVEGRTRQRLRTSLGAEEEEAAPPALVTVPVEVEPPRINADSNGEFVTAYVGLPEDAKPSNLVLESVALEQVSAVSDDQYGFVKNLETKRRKGRTYVMVKFPRDDVVDALGTGTHEPTVTGVVGPTTLHGSTTVEVFDRGNGGSGRGSNDSGNGNGGK